MDRKSYLLAENIFDIKAITSMSHPNTDKVELAKISSLIAAQRQAGDGNIAHTHLETMQGEGFGGLPTKQSFKSLGNKGVIKFLQENFSELAYGENDLIIGQLHRALTSDQSNSNIWQNSWLSQYLPHKKDHNKFQITSSNLFTILTKTSQQIDYHVNDHDTLYPGFILSDGEKKDIIKASFQNAVLQTLCESSIELQGIYSNFYKINPLDNKSSLFIPLSINTDIASKHGKAIDTIIKHPLLGEEFFKFAFNILLQENKDTMQIGTIKTKFTKQTLFIKKEGDDLLYLIGTKKVPRSIGLALLLQDHTIEGLENHKMVIYQGFVKYIGLTLAGVKHIGSERGIRDKICHILDHWSSQRCIHLDELIKQMQQDRVCSDTLVKDERKQIYSTMGQEFQSVAAYEKAINNGSLLPGAGYSFRFETEPNLLDTALGHGQLNYEQLIERAKNPFLTSVKE